MGDPALGEAETVARLQRVVDLWEMSKAVEPDVLVDLAYNMAALGASFVRELASLRGEDPMGTLTGHLVLRDAEGTTSVAWLAELIEMKREKDSE